MIPTPEAPPAAEADPGDFISLWEYFRDLFVPEQRLSLPLKPAHERICTVLQDAFLGDLPPNVVDGVTYPIWFIEINLPPRIGKTKLAEAAISWGEGEFPGSQWIYTSYSGDLAEQSLAYVEKVLRSRWYQEIYGDRVHGKKADHLTTVEGGNLFAEGTGGTLTGKGAGLKEPAGGIIFVDDAAKPDEVLSVTIAESVRFWFINTLLSRRNSDTFTPIVIIGQRLGPGDLSGYVRETYPHNTLVVEIPALVDPKTGEASQADDAVSQFPETVSTASLLSLRSTRTGRYVLASQYQQQPHAFGGNLIQIDSFGRYDPDTALATEWEKLVIPVDTALKIKQSNDFSALALWGLLKRRAYLIDLLHGKWESPELLAMAIAFWEKWKSIPSWPRPKMIIEEKAAGTPLLQNLNRQGVPATGIERDIDKVRRVHTVLPFIETGMVFIPKTGSTPWIAKWETEHAQFAADGKHAHDDIVDTTVDGIEHLLGKSLSIFDVIKSAPPPEGTPPPRPPSGPVALRA